MKTNTQGPELIQRLLELAWKPRKILRQTIAVIIAYFIFLIFRAIAPAPSSIAWLANAIIFIGEVLAYFIILFGMTTVAKMTLAEIRGEEETFVPGNGGTIREVVTSPLKIFAIIAGLVLFHVLIDLWGKIPFVGEICWMISPLVTFPLGIALVATLLILIFGAMVLPTIIALGQEGPVSELIEFLRKNTIKFAGHFLIALTVAIITFVLLVAALGWSRNISLSIMGDKYLYIQKHLPGFVSAKHVPGFRTMAAVQEDTRLGFRAQPGMIIAPESDRWTFYVAGFFFGVIMWLIYMSIWGFILVNFSVAGTLSYVGLTGLPEERVEPPSEEEWKEKAPVRKRQARKTGPAKKKAPEKLKKVGSNRKVTDKSKPRKKG